MKKLGLRYLGPITVLVLAWTLAGRFDLFEWLFHVSRGHESWNLDEIFALLFLLGLCLPFVIGFWDNRLRQGLRERLAAEERARHISFHDPLTGLQNRRVLSRVIGNFIADSERQGGSLAVLLMDLDRFKPVNDLRGHDVGDRILRGVADRLREVCGQGQVPVRLGGDEFAVVLRENATYDAATGLARRILAAMDRKFAVDGDELAVGTSIGIALWSRGIDEEQLFQNAEQAMYRAKREGRGRMDFFDDELGVHLREAAELEVELTAAIEADTIVPYFQPIVDMSDRSLLGFEILARWHHARLGPVPPSRFIPLAEATGQIDAISWLILRQACEAARGWPPELSLSFNLSPRQFQDRDLAATVSDLLQTAGFPPQRLEIEITETAVIEDLAYARETIEQLRWLGIRISLDDFGTGYSSLATLSGLPFDKLKIDRSFVTQLPKNSQKAKIVAGIISLADSLDLVVTAEGIETEETFEMLLAMGCGLGQGYLFERPLPASEITELLHSGRFAGMTASGMARIAAL